MCGGGPCFAGWLCSPAGCYDPNVMFACGNVVCFKAGKYLPGSVCGVCQPHNQLTSPRRLPREELKDAVADKPAAPRVLSHYMHGIEVVPALKVGDDWTCDGVHVGGKSYPLRALDTLHGYLCRPAGTIHCSFSSRSYACLTGYTCNNNPTGTGHSDEECRK
jgi:hypothetical protein